MIAIFVVLCIAFFIIGCTQSEPVSDVNQDGSELAEVDHTLDDLSNELSDIENLINESEFDLEDSGLDENLI
ncbi:MAG: hypothetical protein HON47_01520 [Candidatus Diapherotrites archaeon]|uniref:Uncharacterized protein n=1 Tax=Candidatus Iainarchaeum sp. TaxID=3101447 RepID=A0A8T5GE39_9ARCH|nr:hypothetical protein [Candidatus Diapherotrites archaeon]